MEPEAVLIFIHVAKRLRRFKTLAIPSSHFQSIYTSSFVSLSVTEPIYHSTGFAL